MTDYYYVDTTDSFINCLTPLYQTFCNPGYKIKVESDYESFKRSHKIKIKCKNHVYRYSFSFEELGKHIDEVLVVGKGHYLIFGSNKKLSS